MFMKTMACFLDCTVNSKEVFRNLKVGQDEILLNKANTYRVLFLDFSDFNACDIEKAMGYLRHVMSEVYKYFYNEFVDMDGSCFDRHSFKDVLDIIEGSSSDIVLQRSLRQLMFLLRGYGDYTCERNLAVFLDNLVRLETVAEKNGYSKEMDEFLKGFIIEDVYKYCDLFLQISDSEGQIHDSCFNMVRYRSHWQFSVHSNEIRERHPEMIVAVEDQIPFHNIAFQPKAIDWATRIANERRVLVEAEMEEKLKHQENIRLEKARYSIELLPVVPRLSPNLGIRKKQLDKHSSRYEKLNALLRKLYIESFPEFDAMSLYRLLQRIDYKNRVVENKYELQDSLEKLSQKYPVWEKAFVNTSWGDWVQVICRRKSDDQWLSPAKPENVKVYACFGKGKAQVVFIDSIRYLLTHAKQMFAAKLAVFGRADQMCYWLALQDYPLLERFYKPLADDMEVSMPFVAYKGILGISKEFPRTDDSHNFTQAQIISDYFSIVKGVEEIDLENMYNNYIVKWNADLFEDRPLGFKNGSALSFVVILDTLDAILSGEGINGKSMLFSPEERFWRILAESKCWADVNIKI